MVWQHAYRFGKNGGSTAAVSAGLKDSAWLELLEQHLALTGTPACSCPIYYQYPLGRGVVVSCCAPDPAKEGSIARQLVFSEPADLDTLRQVRPLSYAALKNLPADACASGELPALTAGSLADAEETVSCFRTLDELFTGDELLLSRFISAVCLCARDKRRTLAVGIPGEPEAVSESGRRIMELLLRCISREDALRLSCCSLAGPTDLQYSLRFIPGMPNENPCPQELYFDLAGRRLHLPDDAVLPETEAHAELARALLAHDLNWADRLHGGSVPRPAETIRLDAPPFEAGMSLKQYFSDWRSELEIRRSKLTDEGFRSFAAGEWPQLLNAVVNASELMDNTAFLGELADILAVIRREKLSVSLALGDDTLTDMITLLLDSIRWRQIDLSNVPTARMMRTVTAYSQVISEDACPADCLTACRIINRLLTAPASIQESLSDMALLEETAPARFEALQDCLRQYVQNRLSDELDVIDETLAAAAMLGFAKFSGGVPDLRMSDKLIERIEAQSGSKDARRFQNMLDRLRQNIRPTRARAMRRRDMKILLFISLLLIALILGISAWFLFLS